MKFNHKFDLIKSENSYRQYASGNNIVQLDFISDSALRVAVYKKDEYILPTFCVCPDNKMPKQGRDRLSTKGFNCQAVSAQKTCDGEIITLPNGIKLEVCLSNFILKFYKDDKVILSDRAPLAYNFENEFGIGNFHYVLREENEKIYGLGDKTGKLNKAGMSYRIETTDCMGYDASSSDPLYKHIPFYICENSVGSYGIFYDTSDTSYVDLGKEINNYYAPYKYFKTEDNALVYYVFFGEKLDIIKQFSRLCGKQAFPPKWSFDYCASTMAYTDAQDSNDKMNAFLDKVKELGLSCSGFYLSSGYTSIGDQRFVFNWNYDKFPDPKAFISKFNDNSINIIPNIKPAFLVNHPMYEYIKSNGWFVKNEDATPFVTEFWDGLGSYLDFTNDEASEFWAKQVKEKLLDYGITCTWNDNNEFDIKDLNAIASGFGAQSVKASRIRPILTYLMVNSSYNAQIKNLPNQRPFLSTRSGNIGVRRMAQTWSGDNYTNFKALRYCHYVGLTMSMSGLYFYGHDLGGFSGNMPSRELLLRWIQHGLFEPRFTIHSWNADGSATMPWSYDDIIEPVKELFAQRKQLIPYFYNCAYNAVENDELINAPMFLYYDDEELKDCDSFMFGKDILATCILDEGKDSIEVYLPKKDNWYLGDKLYEGGEKINLTISATSKMPYFVKSGSVLPTDEGECTFGSEPKLTLTVYPISEGVYYAHYFDDDGKTFEYKNNNCVDIKFKVECSKENVIVTCNNKGNLKFNGEIALCNADKRKLIVNNF